MPDNSNPYHNPEYIRKGWSRMTQLLDREMPVSKAPSRWPIWVLLLAAILISAGGYGIFQLTQNTQPEQGSGEIPLTLNTLPHTPEEGPAPTTTIQGEAEASATADGPEVTQTLQTQPRQPVSENEFVQAPSGDAQSIAEKPSRNDPATGRVGAADSKLDRNAPVKDGYPENAGRLPMIKPDLIPAFEKPAITTSAGSNRMPLFVERLATPRLAQASAIDIGVYEPAIRKASKFSLAAFSNIHWGALLKSTGIEGGLAVGYEIANRWSVSTGLSYGHYDRNGVLGFDGTKQLEALELDVENAGGMTTGVVQNVVYTEAIAGNTVSYDTIRDLTDKLNYLQLPVQVHYRVSRKLGISAGLRLALLVSAPSQYGTDESQANFGAAPQFFSRSGQSQNNFLYNYDLLRKFDVAPAVGIQYAFTHRLAATAQYFYGLVPYINRKNIPSRDDYNRSLSIGLSYRLF